MQIRIFETKERLGEAAAAHAADSVREVIGSHGAANLLLATGVSQFEFLAHFTSVPEIDWHRVTGFHLDEYLGLSPDHPAGLRRYLAKRFIKRLPGPLAEFHFISGETDDPTAECARLAALAAASAIHLGCIGIGENGHIAFNDPPADFETDEPFLVVKLDEASRRQQLGEGWFDQIEDVPVQAITMSVRQIMKSRRLLVIVPEQRKARAVAAALAGPVTPEVPASILQRHPDCTIYLDQESAANLDKRN